jgi:ATP:ADP antiporter, AAA family
MARRVASRLARAIPSVVLEPAPLRELPFPDLGGFLGASLIDWRGVGSRVVAIIRRVFDIRPGEGRAVLYTFLFVALAVASFLLAKPIRNALFLAQYGAHQLVYVYVAVPVALSLMMPAYTWIAARVGQRGVVTGSLLFFCLNVLAFWYAFRFLKVPALPAIFYVWVNCYGIIAPVQAWTFANRVFDTRQARRLFGLIGGGASAGAIVGGFLARTLAGPLGTVNLLLILAVMIAISAMLVNVAWKVRRKDIPDTSSPRGRLRFRDTARIVSQTPYLRLIAVLVFLVAIVTQWTQFQFSVAAELRFADDPDSLTRFFGTFNFTMGIVALLVQLFLTGPALRQFGLGLTILVLPIALGVGSAAILLFPVLWAVLLTNALDQGLRFSVDKATFELLYLPIPSNVKLHVKGMIDLLVNRLGDGVGGFTLGLLTQGFNLVFVNLPGIGLGLQGIAAINLVLIAVWIGVAMSLRSGYVAAIQDSIHRYRLDVEREQTRVLDRSAARVLAGNLTGDNPDQILYALRMFEVEHRQAPHPALRSLINHPNARVRSRALAILNHLGDRTLLPQAESLLRDPDLEVRTEALLYLAHHDRVDPLARIQELGDFADFSIRAGLIAFLSRPGRMQNLDAARVILDTMVAEEGEDGVPARAEAARLIGMLPNEFGSELARLLADDAPEVLRPALAAMGSLQRYDLCRVVVPLLTKPELHGDVLQALVNVGEEAVPRLGEYLADATFTADVRREIPIALAHIGTVESRQILTDHLLEPDVIMRFRVIAALNKLHQLHPDVDMDPRSIEMVLTAEIMGHYRSYQILGTIGAAIEGDPVALSLRQSMDHEVERIFRLMQLRWPDVDMYSAYVGLRSQNPSVRANALEFLDNILQPHMRTLIVPLLDSQVSVVERVRLANSLLGTSVDTREQAVAALVRSDDPWMRASGAYAIGMLRLTALAPELDRLVESSDDPLLRETVRAARQKLAGEVPPTPRELATMNETWEVTEESIGIG